ncbi:hypothetical protein D1013_17285 [Euzebyella marina]|uniref:Uncharacterized protein n=1 Tax=Euzebyella marina TaxID=1761453 RepID=A0A3G2L9T9_9FLAO|nr:hypothetical protein [Euzebyella marina]AYN69009.1 hypothetical protein D1013_17285 [Euzebyella marina]
MKKRILILTLITLAASHMVGYSQSRIPSATNGLFSNNLDFFAIQKVSDVYTGGVNEDIKGSIYLFDQWTKLRITSTYKDNYTYSILANYNIMADRFEIFVKGEKYILNPESVVKITKGNRTFKVSEEDLEKNYYEEVASGDNVSLVKIYESKVVEVPTKTLGLIERKISKSEKEFLVFKDGSMTKMPKSRGKLFKALNLTSEKRDKFKKYDIKNDYELAAIIKDA